MEEPHSVSGFYPFILAAQAGHGRKDLDTIYRLVRERPKLIVRAKGKAQGRGIGSSSSIGSRRGINGIPRVNIPHIPPEFLHHLSETESESKRPLTPSVHRPVVHIPSVERKSPVF